MFEDAHGVAVIAASDLARARGFYEGVLGLTPVTDPSEEEVFYRLGQTQVLLYRTGFAGTAKNTVFAIETPHLDRDMASLRERGVTFEEYDFPGLSTVDGVADLATERAAWFTDTEGNVLALSEKK